MISRRIVSAWRIDRARLGRSACPNFFPRCFVRFCVMPCGNGHLDFWSTKKRYICKGSQLLIIINVQFWAQSSSLYLLKNFYLFSNEILCWTMSCVRDQWVGLPIGITHIFCSSDSNQGTVQPCRLQMLTDSEIYV